MTEGAVLEQARRVATADPERHGGEFALLLADQGLGLIESGEWVDSVQLLHEATVFIRMALSRAAPARPVHIPWVTPDLASNQKVLTEKGAEILRGAVRVLPVGHDLTPYAKSRLAHRLLQTISIRDATVLDESIELCAEALHEAPVPDAELLANMGNALFARFGRTSELADLDEAIEYLTWAVRVTSAGNPDLHATQSELSDTLIARFDKVNEASDLALAIDYLRLALESIPDDHADRPAVLCNLGVALRRRFERDADPIDLDESIMCLRSAWQSAGDWRDVVQSNLGSALLQRYDRTGNPGDQQEALQHLNAAVAAVPAHAPDRPAILSALAEALCSVGRLSAARDLLSEALLRRETELGPDHPSTLASRHNLATVMAMLGHCRSAVEEFREVSLARERLLGENHPDVLASRHNLATALAELDQPDEAETEFAVVVHARNEVLGPDHPDTRASQAALERIRRR
jgi:tetratricopeptide (TPR) repeat protein